MKNNNKKLKPYAIFIAIALVLTSSYMAYSEYSDYTQKVKIEQKNNKTDKKKSSTLPEIDVNYIGMSPEKPVFGDEVEVTYEIDPKPFKMEKPPTKPQEIVMVLDRSGSMKDKIKDLKSAAKNFIKSLKDIDNLKIGIVTYSSDGTIDTKPNMLDVSDPALITKIDNMKASGGTNTGEGLRKAEYVLQNGNKEASKSIVLMSDGLPTHYSVQRNGSYYLDIDNTSPSVKSSNSNAKKYAMDIGYLIKIKEYDIYTIGYGLGSDSSEGNVTLRDIHESMGGKSDQFYATDDNIDNIFNSIASSLKDKYKIEDAKLSLELGDKIEISQEDDRDLDISYSLGEDGWYRAEKQLFKFKFKCSNTGDIDVVKNMNLTYKDINGNTVSKEVPQLTVNIEDLKIPDIRLNYLGIDPENPVLGDEVTVTYELDPQPFKLPAPPPQEIVLVLDDSGSMKNNSKIINLKKAAKKFITQLQDTKNLKIGIVAYSTLATINPTFDNKTYKNVENLHSNGRIYSYSLPNYKSNSNPLMYDVKDPMLTKMIDALQAEGGTNTGEGLRKAEYILSNGNPNANKSLILMSDGLPTYKSVIDIRKNKEEYLKIDDSTPGVMGDGSENSQNNIIQSANYAKRIGNIISKKGYNVFTIGYGLGNSNSTSNKTLKEVHSSMGGKDSQFYATDSNIDEIFAGIGDKLGNSYKVDNPKIDFTFSQDIEITEMFDTIPEIDYKLESDGYYRAPKQPIIFKFRTIKPGKIEVVTDPTFSYNKMPLDGSVAEVVKSESVDVSITVKDRNKLVSHGLLNRKDNVLKVGHNQQNIIKNMYYNIGVNIEIKEDNSKLTITPPNIDIIERDTLRVYSHDGSGKIISEINNQSINIENNNIIIDKLNKGKYIISYHSKFTKDTDILASLERENKTFKAIIQINESGNEINNPSLPELF